jgi:hypothetical protein
MKLLRAPHKSPSGMFPQTRNLGAYAERGTARPAHPRAGELGSE